MNNAEKEKAKRNPQSVIGEIKNGHVARSPVFIFGITGGMMSAVGMALAGTIWASKLDQRQHDHLNLTHNMHLTETIGAIKTRLDKHEELAAHLQAEKRLTQILEKFNTINLKLKEIKDGQERSN